MAIRIDRAEQNNIQSIANSVSQKDNGKSLSHISSDKFEASDEMNLQEMADNSVKAKMMAQLQSMADNHSTANKENLRGERKVGNNAGSIHDVLQRRTRESETFLEKIKTPDKYEKSSPVELPYSELSNEEKLEKIGIVIKELIAKSKDTRELYFYLEEVKEKYQLKFAELVDLGTPQARVRFRVNPIEEITLPSGELIYRMIGTITPSPITKVEHHSKNLTFGTQSALVGKHMIANPLAPDHEPGSVSTTDSDQNGIMTMLPNAGNTSIPNDQKYIKGHLLNDHVGGQGKSYNLFPITADANAKHLAFVEKFIKSQLESHYIIYYEIFVDDSPVQVSSSGCYVNSKLRFRWHLLDALGKLLGTVHTGDIESEYNMSGAEPFDVKLEYQGEYDKVNKSKVTPNAIGQAGQWQDSSVSSPSMVAMAPTHFLSLASYTGLVGHFGMSSSTSGVQDFSDRKVHNDTGAHLEFISLRNAEATTLVAGQMIKVASGIVSIKTISPISGGWTRLYF